MRSIIWLILLFAAAVVAATMLGRNDALVSIFYGDGRVDLSLNLFLLALVGLVLLLFIGLQAINSLLSLPTRAREWRLLKRERAAAAALRDAWTELLAARYARAQRLAERALALQAEVPVLQNDLQFAVLAQVAGATGLHRLQDRRGRDERVQHCAWCVAGWAPAVPPMVCSCWPPNGPWTTATPSAAWPCWPTWRPAWRDAPRPCD